MRMLIRIAKDGRATVRVEGGEGTACLEFTRAIEQSLGAVEHREMLPEAQQDPLVVRQREDIQERGL